MKLAQLVLFFAFSFAFAETSRGLVDTVIDRYKAARDCTVKKAHELKNWVQDKFSICKKKIEDKINKEDVKEDLLAKQERIKEFFEQFQEAIRKAQEQQSKNGGDNNKDENNDIEMMEESSDNEEVENKEPAKEAVL